MGVSEAYPLVEDRELPVASALLGPSARDVVGKALATEGGTVESLRPGYASYRPGRRMVVSYEMTVAWPGGRASHETVVAFARRDREPPEGSVPVRMLDTTIGVWRLPHDPFLPGLQAAQDPEFVRGLLDDLGAPAGPVRIKRRAYWPRLRAVVEVTTAGSKAKLMFSPGRGLAQAPPIRLLYLKVVRPDEAARLHRLLQTLAGRVPVPACYGCLEEQGILLLEAKSGRTLFDYVLEGAQPIPQAPDLLHLLDLLAGVEVDSKRVETNTEVARRYAPVLRMVVPREAERIERFIGRLGADSNEALVTTHGDFHEYQLLVDRGRISALLDVDEVSPGHRVDDLAMMAGRFWSFAASERRRKDRLERYTFDLLRAFGKVVDPAELHRRVAAVLFGRATSPFRNQERGWPTSVSRAIQLADEWLDRPIVG